MTTIIDGMVSLPFLDGDFLVPFYWGNLPSFRSGPEHGVARPALPFTRAEAQDVANRDMEGRAISGLMREWVAEHRVR